MPLMTRAHSQEEKDDRRSLIISVVHALFLTTDYQSISMETIAKKAGLSKGTVFFYFRTKQELFLAYTRVEVDAWHDAFDAGLQSLAASGKSLSIDGFLAVMGEFIKGRKPFFRLLSILGSIIEVNIDDETAFAFKSFLLKRMARTGELFERLLKFFRPGDGMRFYQYAFFIICGAYPMSEPAPVVRRILKKPELRVYRIDFEEILLDMLRLILRGWET